MVVTKDKLLACLLVAMMAPTPILGVCVGLTHLVGPELMKSLHEGVVNREREPIMSSFTSETSIRIVLRKMGCVRFYTASVEAAMKMAEANAEFRNKITVHVFRPGTDNRTTSNDAQHPKKNGSLSLPTYFIQNNEGEFS